MIGRKGWKPLLAVPREEQMSHRYHLNSTTKRLHLESNAMNYYRQTLEAKDAYI